MSYVSQCVRIILKCHAKNNFCAWNSDLSLLVTHTFLSAHSGNITTQALVLHTVRLCSWQISIISTGERDEKNGVSWPTSKAPQLGMRCQRRVNFFLHSSSRNLFSHVVFFLLVLTRSMFFIAAFVSSSVWLCLKYYCNLQFVSTKNCHSTKSAHTSRVQLHSSGILWLGVCILQTLPESNATDVKLPMPGWQGARAPLQFLHYYCWCVVFSDSLLFLFRCWSRLANGSTIHLCTNWSTNKQTNRRDVTVRPLLRSSLFFVYLFAWHLFSIILMRKDGESERNAYELYENEPMKIHSHLVFASLDRSTDVDTLQMVPAQNPRLQARQVESKRIWNNIHFHHISYWKFQNFSYCLSTATSNDISQIGGNENWEMFAWLEIGIIPRWKRATTRWKMKMKWTKIEITAGSIYLLRNLQLLSIVLTQRQPLQRQRQPCYRSTAFPFTR